MFDTGGGFRSFQPSENDVAAYGGQIENHLNEVFDKQIPKDKTVEFGDYVFKDYTPSEFEKLDRLNKKTTFKLVDPGFKANYDKPSWDIPFKAMIQVAQSDDSDNLLLPPRKPKYAESDFDMIGNPPFQGDSFYKWDGKYATKFDFTNMYYEPAQTGLGPNGFFGQTKVRN